MRALHKPPIIVAHRGIHDAEPENSLGAFRAAVREKFNWIEFDVQASADHHPVIIHDATLDRTTMGTGSVDAHTAAELAAIHHRQADGTASYRRLKVLGRGPHRLPAASYLIEVKPPDAYRLVKRLARFARAPGCVIQSFDSRNLEHAKRHAYPLKRHLLVESREGLVAALDSPWDGVNALHTCLDAELVKELRARGKAVGAWTVNEPADIRRVIALNVDLIISDKPATVREIVLTTRPSIH